VLIQKPNQSKPLIELICRINPNILIDIDDAVWASPPLKRSLAAQESKLRFRRRFVYACSRAKCVITGSDYLAARIHEFQVGTDTITIPSSVDLETYKNVKSAFRKDQIPVIGWIGSPGNFRDLDRVLKALNSVVESGKCRLSIVSSNPPNLGVPFDFKIWSADSEVESLLDFDIGIMPLWDDERSLGRCGYKAIQYMAVGIPVVCSASGAGLDVLTHGREGFQAASDQQWIHSLNELIANPVLRKEMGYRGRKKVEQSYSIQANLPKWLGIMSEYANSAE
jgi:glycosyltransferase involved in cell wall biosynthesis